MNLPELPPTLHVGQTFTYMARTIRVAEIVYDDEDEVSVYCAIEPDVDEEDEVSA